MKKISCFADGLKMRPRKSLKSKVMFTPSLSKVALSHLGESTCSIFFHKKLREKKMLTFI